MKLQHHADYTPEDTTRSESTLLTVWAILREFREDLVLVGGLVPRYLCRRSAGRLHAVTMDVDLGISLGLSSGLYETTGTRLTNSGFDFKDNRFVKTTGQATLFLDFLTDKPDAAAPDSVMVDDIPVSAAYGVQRALEIFREIDIQGCDVFGAEVTEKVRVCEVGPYVCLKLRAYGNRGQSKDVFDFIRCVRDYDKTVDKAARLFHEEKGKNLAYESALQVLEERFTGEKSKGPVQYADFCLGGLDDESSDLDFKRAQMINEALDVARVLLG